VTVAPFPQAEGANVENALLGGRVRLRQPAKGYRAGMDAALLAATVAAEPGQRVIEAGCGAGAVLMQIAARRPDAALTGLERDPAMAALARENVALNGADARIVEGDVAAGFRALDLPPFDWAVSNPPFFDDPGALRAPAEGKRGAWMADDGLKAWTTFLLKSVREGGRIVVIHRADRLADLLALRLDRSRCAACIRMRTSRRSGCWCRRSRPARPRCACCRRWCCTTGRERSIRRRRKRC
jgi:tRNA1(Val) A37 N6-methylase TrmN6